MEEMIVRWLKETRTEYSKAKLNQNYYKMLQMNRLEQALLDLKRKLSNPL